MAYFDAPLASDCPNQCGRALIKPLARKHVSHAPWLGRRIHRGQVTLIDVLGKGGMGAVYLGLESLASTERKVAVKFVLKENIKPVDWPSYQARFLREAKAMLNLQHPSAIKLHAFGNEDDDLYMILDFIEGRTLSKFMRDEGAISFARAARIIIPILNVLNEAHQNGVIHRDLKPDNLMVQVFSGDDLQVKVMDFGISKFMEDDSSDEVTKQGFVVGTPFYMAPEQTRGKPQAESDLYSVGAILFELLMGYRLFQGKDNAETVQMQRHSKPPRLTPELAYAQPLLDRALAKEPKERFQSAGAFLEALRRVLEGKPINDPTLTYSLNSADLEPLDQHDNFSPNEGQSSISKVLTTPTDHRPVWLILGLSAMALLAWLGYLWLGQPSQQQPTAPIIYLGQQQAVSSFVEVDSTVSDTVIAVDAAVVVEVDSAPKPITPKKEKRKAVIAKKTYPEIKSEPKPAKKSPAPEPESWKVD
ncbi:serine/threonine protein kinase [Myxococcota bacterium]|nr:serine/threonine protein kinase [Myxococcota bacterium]